MASTTRKILTNWKFIVVVVSLLLAAVAINPQLDTDGASVRTVIKDSSAFVAGMENPKENTAPTKFEIVTAINNEQVKTVKDYNDLVANLEVNETVTIETNRGFYTLITQPLLKSKVIGEENQTVEETITRQVNGTLINETVNVTKLVNITTDEVIGVKELGLRVNEVAGTNLVKGLDLAGGTRVLLEPETQLEQNDMDSLVQNLKLRLNVFGLSDVIVREAKDLDGNQFVLVEIAGANEEEVRELLAKQGKFEAQVGNQTVFKGGDDITYVCRSADCSGIDPNAGCGQSGEGYTCRFQFQISLSPEAAQRQADVTAQYPLVGDAGNSYVSEPLVLFLDNEEVDSLQIAADLRGRAVTDISISGSGAGISQDLAIEDSLLNMKRLQTILVTGSLPVKLNIVNTKNISAQLGDQFLKNAILLGLASILAVVLFVFLRYRRLSISIPMMITMLSEVGLIMGFAALFKWNLDLTAIAGIIIAVGTGVDDQIVITDEILEGQHAGTISNWRQRMKRAFAIIFTAWGTTMVAMGPLLFAGAGLLRGFALTTMAGITFGVFITRPAFAKVIEIILNK